MTNKLNEDFNPGSFNAPGPVVSPASISIEMPDEAEYQPDLDIPARLDPLLPAEIPADVDKERCDHISVYVDSASVTGYNPTSDVKLDIVLNVSISNPETYEIHSYKIVKRIAFDKIQLALETEKLDAYQVVESEEGKAIKKALAEEQLIKETEAKKLARIRRMAGLE